MGRGRGGEVDRARGVTRGRISTHSVAVLQMRIAEIRTRFLERIQSLISSALDFYLLFNEAARSTNPRRPSEPYEQRAHLSGDVTVPSASSASFCSVLTEPWAAATLESPAYGRGTMPHGPTPHSREVAGSGGRTRKTRPPPRASAPRGQEPPVLPGSSPRAPHLLLP